MADAAPAVLGVYQPRRPQASPLFRLVQDHLHPLQTVYDERFAREYGPWCPVVAEVADKFLACGILEHGFARIRPTTLAEQLKHLDAVNIGAAGTFVIRRPITRTQLRAELARRLPFDTEIMICEGREIVRLVSQSLFADQPVRPDIVRFVSVLSKRTRPAPSMPMSFPSSGTWLLKILGMDKQYVFGVYRRHMKVISYVGTFDRLFGVPVTMRNWNTITAIARVLGNGGT